jgi:hypothetical protein
VRFSPFELIGQIVQVERIAVHRGIRHRALLDRSYGRGRWRKLKGVALVRLSDGSIHWAEVHWYEAHGIGRRGLRVKRILGDTE